MKHPPSEATQNLVSDVFNLLSVPRTNLTSARGELPAVGG